MRSSKQIIEQRGQMLTRMEELQKISTEQRRSLTYLEQKEWDTISNDLEKLEPELEHMRSLENNLKAEASVKGNYLSGLSPNDSQNRKYTGMQKPSGSWRTENGSEVNVFSPDEKVFNERDEPEYRLGTLVRAFVAGARNEEEKRALNETVDQQGALTVPKKLSQEIIDRYRVQSRVIEAGARTVLLDSNNLTIAKIVADPVPTWRPESGVINMSQPIFAKVDFNAKSVAMIIPVTREVLQDSVNIEEAVERAIYGGMAAEVDRICLLGTGTDNEPLGLYNTPGVGSMVMPNGGVISSYSPIIQGYGSLLKANVPGSKISAIMNSDAYIKFADLVDTTGQPLRKPDLISDVKILETMQVPQTEIEGSPDEFESVIAMGDFRDLVIGVREGIKITFLKHGFFEKGESAFLVHARLDVAVMREESFLTIQNVK